MTLPLDLGRAMLVVDLLLALLDELAPGAFDPRRFPRDMIYLCALLEVPVVNLPDLTPQTASRYTGRLANRPAHTDDDRPLYGLLHIGPPSNMIFLRTGLSQPAVRYILAHELGHFLADVYLIRRLWLETLPAQKAAILRLFSWQQADAWLDLQAFVKGLPGRPQAILARNDAPQETVRREMLADLVARELLAPWEQLAAAFQQTSRDTCLALLQREYGLPLRIAHLYYTDLARSLSPQPDLFDRVFGSLKSKV